VALVEVTQAAGPRLIVNNEEERFSGIKHTTEYPRASIDAMAALLRGRASATLPPDRPVPLALRGSSMGGYMALLSAAQNATWRALTGRPVDWLVILPNALADWMLALDLGPWGFLLVVNLLLLIAGNFMEPSSIILIMAPILFPTAMRLGIDPVHFGVVAVVNIMIGLVTPPYGLLLFMMVKIAEVSLKDLVREVMPFASLSLESAMPCFAASRSRLSPTFMVYGCQEVSGWS